MKAPLLSCIVALLSAMTTHAIDQNAPFPRMPNPGSGGADLEQRVRELERRLAAMELAPDKKKAAEPNPNPSADISNTVGRAQKLLKAGDYAAASRTYQEALQECLARMEATPQALTDSFSTCYFLAIAGETLLAKGERGLAKELWEDALKGLRLCRKVAPEWLPKIVEYRLQRVEKQLAELQ